MFHTNDSLIMHCQTYPCLEIQDVFKFLYQSTFGCEHMITSLDACINSIYKELSCRDFSQQTNNLVEPLDGTYSRVYLDYINKELSPETLGKLFFFSAQQESNGKARLEEKLLSTRKLICENILPFSLDAFDEAVEKWKLTNYEAVHHSDTFRSLYHPSYRVISNDFVPFLSFFSIIDKLTKRNRTLKIAIEGGSASGKTTLSKMLEEIYDCTVFHMDDFFLRPEQRTPERYAEPGGNIDYERFLSEILMPLTENETVCYRRFDCSKSDYTESIYVKPKKLIIIEGTYSMHPKFADYYDLSVFLNVSSELQRARIEKRNTKELSARFFEEWIPLEHTYFSKTEILNRCTLNISINK